LGGPEGAPLAVEASTTTPRRLKAATSGSNFLKKDVGIKDVSPDAEVDR
jgi:hypothetical protein